MIERQEITAIMRAVSTVVRDYVGTAMADTKSRLDGIQPVDYSKIQTMVTDEVAKVTATIKRENAFTEDDARFVEAEFRKELSLT